MRAVVLAALVTACALRAPRLPRSAAAPLAPEAIRPRADAAASSQTSVHEARSPSPLFGTRHPLALVAVDARERWLVVCQARRDTDGDGEINIHAIQHGGFGGDNLVPYFIMGGGGGEAIDHFVSASNNGDWLVFVRRGALTLYDVARARAHTLGRPSAGRDSLFGPDTAVSFSSDSTHLLYERRRGHTQRLVVRTLADGTEREIDPGPGHLWRARFLGNTWILVELAAEDVDGNGALDLPGPIPSRVMRRCRGSFWSYHSFGWRGDVQTTRWFSVDGGSDVALGEALVAWGDRVVVRRADAIELVSRGGSRRELVPAACAGQLAGSDEESSRLLFVCRNGEGDWRRPEVVSLDGRSPLDVEVPRQTEDALRAGRFVGVQVRGLTANTAQFVDLRLGRLISAPGHVIAWAVDGAIVAHGQTLSTLDLATGAEMHLPLAPPPNPWIRHTANYGWVGGAVVDIARRRIVGAEDERIVEISDSSRALVIAARRDDIPIGPLRWEDLRPFDSTRRHVQPADDDAP